MTPETLPVPLPEALPLPGPPWLLHGLLLLTFFLHLVGMNLMLGGVLIALVTRWRARAGSPGHELATLVGRALPTSVAAAVSLGVAALLFAQVTYGRTLFSSSILMAWSWIAVVPALIAAYYSTYVASMAGPWRSGRATFFTAAAALLLAAIAFVYSNNMSLMLRPDVFLETYARDGRGLTLNLADRTLVPRYLHAVLGALAVGGWGIALLAHLAARGEALRREGMRTGFTWLAVATGLNVIAGAAWFMTLARPVRDAFHGGDPVASVGLAVGVLLSFVLVRQAWSARRADRPARALRHTGLTLFTTLALMVLTRDTVRTETLSAFSIAEVPWVEPQWGMIAAFVILLALALGSIGWMVVALWRASLPART